MIVPPAPQATEPPLMIELTGTIVLNGNENETYVITEEGCVGLGTHEDLHEGRQLVIRDESGQELANTRIRVRGNLMFSSYQGGNTQRAQAMNSFDRRIYEELSRMR